MRHNGPNENDRGHPRLAGIGRTILSTIAAVLVIAMLVAASLAGSYLPTDSGVPSAGEDRNETSADPSPSSPPEPESSSSSPPSSSAGTEPIDVRQPVNETGSGTDANESAALA